MKVYDSIRFTIAIKQKNTEYLRQLLGEISDPKHLNYGKWLSYDEIHEIIVDTESVEQVKNWIETNNFNCTHHYDHSDCNAPIEQIIKIFKVEFEIDENKNIKLITDYITPTEIINSIRFIDGISNPKQETHKKNIKYIPTPPYIDNGLIAREVIMRIHNVTHTKVNDAKYGSGGIVEFEGGPYKTKDVETFATYYNNVDFDTKNVFPCISVGKKSDTESSETLFDMELMTTIAPGLCLGEYSYTSWLYSAFANIVTQKNITSVIAVSYSYPLEKQCQIANCSKENNKEYVYSVDTEFVKLGLMGKTIVVGSGFGGSPSNSNPNCKTFDNGMRLFAQYPASSPYVLTVGGSVLFKSKERFIPETTICKEFGCANGTHQLSVDLGNIGWSSSAGYNIYSDRLNDSNWQNEFVNEYLNSGIYLPKNSSLWNSKGRAYPDMMALSHDVAVYGTYGPGNMGSQDGPDASTQIIGALIVLLNDYFERSFGFINPLLYGSAKYGTFDRVHATNTTCTNHECCDADFGFTVNSKNETKFNSVVGLGSLNFGKLITYLEDNICS